MTCGIYKITNKITKESYIGASKDIENRFYQHSHNNSTYIGKIIKKYGVENFKFEILKECSIDEFYYEERKYIKKDNTFKKGYNKTPGGEHNYNTTGFYRVRKIKNENYYTGYAYNYVCFIDGERISYVNKSIYALKETVESNGLTWKVIDNKLAEKNLIENNINLNKVRYTNHINETGIFRVSKKIKKNCKQGYLWRYSFRDCGKITDIQSADLELLEKKVKEKNLPWIILDNERTIQSYELNKHNKKCGKVNKPKTNKTGIYRVSKKGKYWVYRYYDAGKQISINNKDLLKLEDIVKSKGLPWMITDEELASKTLKE